MDRNLMVEQIKTSCVLLRLETHEYGYKSGGFYQRWYVWGLFKVRNNS